MNDLFTRLGDKRTHRRAVRSSAALVLLVATLVVALLSSQPTAAAQDSAPDADWDAAINHALENPGTVVRFGGTDGDNIAPQAVIETHVCAPGNNAKVTLDLDPAVSQIQFGDDASDAAGPNADAVRVRAGSGPWNVISISGCTEIWVNAGVGPDRLEIAAPDTGSPLDHFLFFGGTTVGNALFPDPDPSIVTIDGALPMIRWSFYLSHGDDVFTATNANQAELAVVGFDGDDLITTGAGRDRVWGGNGNDTLIGRQGSDLMYGGAGNDTLRGGDGNDFLRGEAGDDRVVGGHGADSLKGGDGADIMYGNGDKDWIEGEGGWDTIWGGPGNDNIKGGSGNDQLSGSVGHDYISGGGGDDVAFGGNGADVINGGSGADMLYGGDGNDMIKGNSRNDVLRGGNGDDVLNGGSGNDTMYGYAGYDACTGPDGGDRFIDCEDLIIDAE